MGPVVDPGGSPVGLPHMRETPRREDGKVKHVRMASTVESINAFMADGV